MPCIVVGLEAICRYSYRNGSECIFVPVLGTREIADNLWQISTPPDECAPPVSYILLSSSEIDIVASRNVSELFNYVSL